MNEQKLTQMRALSKVDEIKLADAQNKDLCAAKKAALQLIALDYGSDKRLINYDVRYGIGNIITSFDMADVAAFHNISESELFQSLCRSSTEAAVNLSTNKQRKLTKSVLKKIAKDFYATHDRK